MGHDLPRALLRTSPSSPSVACSQRMACACSTSKSCPRTEARCGSTAPRRRRRASPTRPRPRDARARARGRATSGSRLHVLRRARRGRQAPILEFLIGLKDDGRARRRLRRAGEGQHAAQLLRRASRLPRLHGRPQSAQAGALLPGSHIPIRAPRAIREDRPDVVVDPALEPQGGDRPAAALHRGVGRTLRCAHAGAVAALRRAPRGRRITADAGSACRLGRLVGAVTQGQRVPEGDVAVDRLRGRPWAALLAGARPPALQSSA